MEYVIFVSKLAQKWTIASSGKLQEHMVLMAR